MIQIVFGIFILIDRETTTGWLVLETHVKVNSRYLYFNSKANLHAFERLCHKNESETNRSSAVVAHGGVKGKIKIYETSQSLQYKKSLKRDNDNKEIKSHHTRNTTPYTGNSGGKQPNLICGKNRRLPSVTSACAAFFSSLLAGALLEPSTVESRNTVEP